MYLSPPSPMPAATFCKNRSIHLCGRNHILITTESKLIWNFQAIKVILKLPTFWWLCGSVPCWLILLKCVFFATARFGQGSSFTVTVLFYNAIRKINHSTLWKFNCIFTFSNFCGGSLLKHKHCPFALVMLLACGWNQTHIYMKINEMRASAIFLIFCDDVNVCIKFNYIFWFVQGRKKCKRVGCLRF